MKLYFGNAVTSATTGMILIMLGFIGYSVYNRENIQYWGRRTALLLIFGLVVCCFAAARDGLNNTAHHRRQLRAGDLPAHQYPHRCRLHRGVVYHYCRDRHTCRKNAAGARGVVLYHVGRCGDEDRHHGDRENFYEIIISGGTDEHTHKQPIRCRHRGR